MKIRMKKTADGVALSCLRDDGTVAVQRTRHGGFFALHDLLHYAVETTLGYEQAFWGLMATGWDFETFGDREDPRSRALPHEALVAEHLVNVLSRHVLARARHDPELRALWAEEINNEAVAAIAQAGRAMDPIDTEALARIADAAESLIDRWARVPVGEHLELDYPAR